MPPNPNVSPEFKHQLSAEQATSADAAIAAGRQVDTKGDALRNILQAYEEPGAALQALADGRATMEARWNQLDAIKNAGGLGQQQRDEYDRLERQIKGNQQLEASVPTAYQRQRAEELVSYQTMEMPELAGVVNNLRERQQQANAARDAARRTAGPGYATNPDYIRANATAQAARTRLQQADNVFNQRDRPAREATAQQAAAQREQQRQQEENRIRQQRTELEGMDVRGLRNEITRLGNTVTDLQARRTARVAAGAGAEELAEIARDIARAQERNTEADRILGNKLTGATEAIDEDVARQADESFAQRATSQQLWTEINDRTTVATNLRSDVENLRTALDNLALNPDQRRNFQNDLYDQMQNLKREEAVLKRFQDELSKSNREFRNMNPNQRAEELAKIGEDLDMALYDRDTIEDMLLQNQAVTKEQLAAWTKLTIGELVQHGRRNIDMGELNRILSNRQELRLALAKGFENSREAKNLIGAELPTNWQKMWRLAGKYQGWLMILLAILAGATAGAAVLAGPLAGAAVSGGSLTAGGAGVFAYGRRRG